MATEEDKQKASLLNELESIKGLLHEDDNVPTLSDDDDIPVLSNDDDIPTLDDAPPILSNDDDIPVLSSDDDDIPVLGGEGDEVPVLTSGDGHTLDNDADSLKDALAQLEAMELSPKASRNRLESPAETDDDDEEIILDTELDNDDEEDIPLITDEPASPPPDPVAAAREEHQTEMPFDEHHEPAASEGSDIGSSLLEKIQSNADAPLFEEEVITSKENPFLTNQLKDRLEKAKQRIQSKPESAPAPNPGRTAPPPVEKDNPTIDKPTAMVEVDNPSDTPIEFNMNSPFNTPASSTPHASDAVQDDGEDGAEAMLEAVGLGDSIGTPGSPEIKVPETAQAPRQDTVTTDNTSIADTTPLISDEELESDQEPDDDALDQMFDDMIAEADELLESEQPAPAAKTQQAAAPAEPGAAPAAPSETTAPSPTLSSQQIVEIIDDVVEEYMIVLEAALRKKLKQALEQAQND